MSTMASTRARWRYPIESPGVFRRDAACRVIGTFVLRPVEGDDIDIELCPEYAAGQAAPDDLRLRIAEVVGDAEEVQKIFNYVSFILAELIDARSTSRPVGRLAAAQRSSMSQPRPPFPRGFSCIR
jgi:hypothetical protein